LSMVGMTLKQQEPAGSATASMTKHRTRSTTGAVDILAQWKQEHCTITHEVHDTRNWEVAVLLVKC